MESIIVSSLKFQTASDHRLYSCNLLDNKVSNYARKLMISGGTLLSEYKIR